MNRICSLVPGKLYGLREGYFLRNALTQNFEFPALSTTCNSVCMFIELHANKAYAKVLVKDTIFTVSLFAFLDGDYDV